MQSPVLRHAAQLGKRQAAASTAVDLSKVHSVDDFQRLAKKRLPKPLYEYLASGSDDEQTLCENRMGFSNLALRPRALLPLAGLSSSVPDFCGTGRPLSLPVFASPAGVHQLVHADGECATARACETIGTVMGLSQHSTKSIEEVRNAAPRAHRWFQSYLLKDRDLTLSLIHRAVRAGSSGIFLTVDSVRFGFREADARNGFNALPDGLELANYRDFEAEETSQRKEHAAWDQNTETLFDDDATWDDVRWLRGVIDDATSKFAPEAEEETATRRLPLIIKGVMTAEDAAAAVDAGADGVMVSTHGGRQLDSTLGAIDALPEVVASVRKLEPDATKFHVLLDSGVRRGTDVVKALALGASAVGIGKPLYFALSVGGERGLTRLFDILRTETETAMALCGCRHVSDIHSGIVQRRRSVANAAHARFPI